MGKRTEIAETFVIIRMFANDEEFDGDYETPYYAAMDMKESGGVEWKLTRNFREAATLKSADIAKRLVRSIPEFRKRVDRAWGYQIVRISEEILETNIEFEDDDVQEVEAA